jgi:hypothetical protein
MPIAERARCGTVRITRYGYTIQRTVPFIPVKRVQELRIQIPGTVRKMYDVDWMVIAVLQKISPFREIIKV